jgi:beta-lactamase regulating signal transducer with metallopeptidase domain
MLEKIFLQILNMSFTASFVIIFVLIARLLLKKSPKVFSYALWGVVLFRLICPFTFESMFSLLPAKTNAISQDIVYATVPTIDTGISTVNHAVNSSLHAATPTASINPLQVWVSIGIMVWLLGITVLLVYSIISLVKLQRCLKNAVNERDNIYLAKHLETPFVMGIIRPKIYLPTSLSDEEKRYILLHEEMHIRRFDHVVKILSFFVLCLHWFNPLVWAAFFVSGRDMEMSCDEAVIKQLGSDVKKEYSTSLLTLATGRRIIGGTPLAFGEGDTKGRIRNVLNYKKPAFWVVALSFIIVVALGIGFATNQKAERSFEMSGNYLSDIQPDEIAGNIASNNSADIITTPSETINSEYSIMKLGKNGEVLYESSLETQSLAQAIIMDSMVKSAAWEGSDISTLEESYRIRQNFPKVWESHDYYAYRLADGRSVLQSEELGMYTILSDYLYSQLVALFSSESRLSFWVKPDESPQVIGKEAAMQWLNSYMGEKVSRSERISDYTIDRVTVLGSERSESDDGIEAYTIYARIQYEITTATDEYSSPEDDISGKGTFSGLFRELNIKMLDNNGNFEIVSVSQGKTAVLKAELEILNKLGILIHLPENGNWIGDPTYRVLDETIAQVEYFDKIIETDMVLRAGKENIKTLSGISYSFDVEREEKWFAETMEDGSPIDIKVQCIISGKDMKGVLAGWSYKGFNYALWTSTSDKEVDISPIAKTAVYIAKHMR